MPIHRRSLLAGLAAGFYPGWSFADAVDAMCGEVKICQDREPPYACALLVPPYPSDCHRYFSLADQHPFDPSALDPSPVHGWWLAEASALAYHPWPQIAQVGVPHAGVVPIGEVSSGDSGPPFRARGYIASGKGFVIVVFCGTEAGDPSMFFRDLLVDFDPLPVAPGWIEDRIEGRVHRGFAGAFGTVWEQVCDELEHRTAGGEVKVWFTGHSLGAALATLAAARWSAKTPHAPAVLYTFGSPRVGDQDFASDCERRGFPILRYVHDQDIVARVPPTLPLGYQDVGTDAVYFGDDGSNVQSTDLWAELFDAVRRPSFRQELIWAAPQQAPEILGLLLQLALGEGTQAALLARWRPIAEAFANAAPEALIDHAPIYYIKYFKNQIS